MPGERFVGNLIASPDGGHVYALEPEKALVGEFEELDADGRARGRQRVDRQAGPRYDGESSDAEHLLDVTVGGERNSVSEFRVASDGSLSGPSR